MRAHPDLPETHANGARLRRIRFLRARGRGTVILHLDGTGHVSVRRGRGDGFTFEGEGHPRFLSGQHVLLAGARGRLEVQGLALEVEFHGGWAAIELHGEFASSDAPRRGRLVPSRRAGGS